VRFGEAPMEGNRQTEDLRLLEAEGDEAHEGPAFEGVELDAARYERPQEHGFGRVADHQEIPPHGGQEDGTRAQLWAAPFGPCARTHVEPLREVAPGTGAQTAGL